MHAGGYSDDEPDSPQVTTNKNDIAALEILVGTPDGASNAADIAANVVTLAGKAALGEVAGVRTPTANDILVLTDGGKVVEMNNASARTITIPPNGDVAFPVGTIIHITRLGVGTVALVEGAAVTLRSAGDEKFIANQYSGGTIYQRAADEWVLFGDLAAS